MDYHIPKNLMIFRPLKNEKHSNILIDMFDELNIIEKTPIINDAINNYYLTESGIFSKQGININKNYFTSYK